MKTSYFLVVLVALTLVPEDVDGWFFRSVRRIRISPYHTLGCMAACKWARSWACKVCKRKRGLDQHTADELDDEALDVPKVLQTLDVNGDGFVELSEIAQVTGLKVGNPVFVKRFHKADLNGDGKLDIHELEAFNFENKKEFLEAIKDDDADDSDDVTF
ncbi:EF-hand calcium-binding domain-containing protein 1-like [Gigantopelta aegis]|uniref:EF-hand calcium-binding domain-containing protein 1-like n=1 Tax=Gigantopelta aegis TaxID=1735272 RepID=UPI001B88DACD|nr:EF-hand calcium-binding domain-containing protein 1-like [Gigantopelta aegis]XP_041362138.1 EF-hand calcium-binding domain-containing protein 1-like [Gigantopelta aegis]